MSMNIQEPQAMFPREPPCEQGLCTQKDSKLPKRLVQYRCIKLTTLSAFWDLEQVNCKWDIY